MIDEVYKLSGLKPEDAPMLQQILGRIHTEAIGFEYTDTVPTQVPFGKFVIYDDGAGTMRLYVKTGQQNIGYVTLT